MEVVEVRLQVAMVLRIAVEVSNTTRESGDDGTGSREFGGAAR